MSKIIVCYSSHNQGIALVEALSRRYSAEPAYWIGGLPDFKEHVEQKFPRTVYQTQLESNIAGPPPAIVLEKGSQGVDTSELESFQRMALSIMDRFLDNIGIQSEQDKLSHFYFLSDRYYRLLKKQEPLFAYFGEIPHSLGTFILYSLCLKLNIRTVISGYTCFKDRFRYIERFEHIGNTPAYQPQTAPTAQAKSEVDALISKLQGDNYIAARPYYMARKGHRNPLYIMKRLGVFVYKWRVKRKFQPLVVNVLPAEPYVYIALHYQPELSTIPMGGHFANQWLMISMIADNLPAGWKIVVKEHPTQVVYTKSNQRFFRSAYFYRSIAAISNVVFIDTDFDSFKLLDTSRAVATVTGTIALEAVLRGKNCMVFGSSPVDRIDGVIKVHNQASCAEAFEHISRGIAPDLQKTRRHLEALYDDSLPYRIAGDTDGFEVDKHLHRIESLIP